MKRKLFAKRMKLKGLHSGLWGDYSGLWGDCSGLEGDLDECEIIDEERKKGVNIQDLITEEK